MEMHQIRYFIAVAEELHFSRAAQREHVSQPPLSLQIKKLEDELGVVLFERTKRHVKLSEAGAAFLPAARAILESAKVGRLAAERAHRGETGRTSIGFVHSASISYLPKLIGPFRQKFPQTGIEFHEMSVSEQIDALAIGAIDVGIVRPPVLDPTIVSFSVQREGFCVAVPIAHRLCGKTSVTMSDLRDENFVFYPRHRSPAFYNQLISLCASAGFSPQIAVEANTMYTAIGLVGTGVGIALLPQSISMIAAPTVRYIDLADTSFQSELCLAYRPDNPSRAAKALVDFARTPQMLPDTTAAKASILASLI
ncbi:LysR family transcriptional regulator [Devosia algicola]|uniref:LysR family transcriptional regulator n=1 Tax=Devosia algicola TaxID=3026418 RepID=A0ABY7YRP3_9HYPH|nr:LysR family transcriptional regulator [Devosia algicola]WDR03941.1 LysR family transcriptional regulator [Devosia algicola]